MASVTLTIQSLINTAVYDSYTLDNSTTVANVKAAIQSNTSVDATWYQLVYNNELMSNTAATLADYGITSNVTLLSANKIGRLNTLEDRQKAKLDLAALDRTADGNPWNVYDITELPTQYSGNTVVDNPNPGGLLEGRPWAPSAVTALFTSLGAEFEIRVDDTTGISPGMIMTGMDYGGATVTVVTVNSSTSLEMSIIAPDTVPAAGTVLTFTNP